MGAQLVGRAIAFQANNDLKPNEYRLLVYMAHTAKDADQPPRYFASREASAFGIGRMVPDEPDLVDPRHDQKCAERKAAFQAVKVAVKGLVDVRAIKQLRAGAEGVRAEYALTFEGLSLEGRKSLQAEVGNSYRKRRDSKPVAFEIPTPQEYQEPQEPTRGEISPKRASHLQPVDNSDERKSA
ncbi:hypothetical protein ABH923_000929 [Leifsonia sp. EB41]|uniref:hypothetical protein n=1 Tax=Leifsonia sp. EB41 TaxID=3156260 RepID=UPI00351599AA